MSCSCERVFLETLEKDLGVEDPRFVDTGNDGAPMLRVEYRASADSPPTRTLMKMKHCPFCGEKYEK